MDVTHRDARSRPVIYRYGVSQRWAQTKPHEVSNKLIGLTDAANVQDISKCTGKYK